MPPRASSMPQPLPGGIARPHERDGAPFARRRAKTPNLRGTERARKRMILESDAIEHVLPGGQTLEQRLGGEIALRQSVDEDGAANSFEALAGRDLDQHAGWSIRPRPDNRGIDADVAGLDAVGNHRPIGGTAQRGLGDATGGRHRRRRSRSSQEAAPRQRRAAAHDGHRASAVESPWRKLPASSDRDSTLVRQLREDLAARRDAEAQARLALMCRIENAQGT